MAEVISEQQPASAYTEANQHIAVKQIKVHDKIFIPYLSQQQIENKIQELAATLDIDYAGKKPLFIAILNGAFMFADGLFKCITLEAEICFIKLASYKGTQSTGHVITAIGLDADIHQRHVIILEDIIDTGKTMTQFILQILNQQPASLKLATLLHKPDAAKYEVRVDYNCFSIPDKFVVGFGLDYDGLGRNLPEI